MKNVLYLLKKMKDFHEDESGDILQVGIIMGILAVIAVGAFIFLKPKMKALFDKTGQQLDNANQQAY